MTSDAADWDERRFVAVWPETARRLEAYLTRRGVASAEAEDIAQEVAIRAVRRQVRFHDAGDFQPWVRTVAWRIRISNVRLAAGHPGDADPVDVASTQSVEDEVLARLRFAEVASAIAELPARDRRALLAPIERDTGLHGTSQAVIRHRARAKLLSRFDGPASLPGGRIERGRSAGRARLIG